MKLSRKNAAIQQAIRKSLASGKALGGLLVGLAATVAGCRENSPANTMGLYIDPHYQENAENENQTRRAIPGEPPEPQPAETNTANECTNDTARHTMGKYRMPTDSSK